MQKMCGSLTFPAHILNDKLENKTNLKLGGISTIHDSPALWFRFGFRPCPYPFLHGLEHSHCAHVPAVEGGVGQRVVLRSEISD